MRSSDVKIFEEVFFVKKKFLALLLAFVMVAGMLPLTALAETTPPNVVKSPLGDTAGTYTSAQLNLDGYTVTTVQDSSYTSDNTVTVYEVTVKHPALLQHYNAASPKAAGLWVGIGVPITIKGADSGQGEDASSYFPFITNKSNFSEVVTMFKETGYAGSDNGYKGYSAWGYRSNDGTHVFQWYNVAGDKYKPNSGYTPYLVERNPQTTESKTTTYTYNVYRIKFDVTEGHLVKFETPANGTLKVTADGKDVTNNMPYAVGTVLTITATPAEGYTVGSVKVGETALTAESDGTYKYTVADADVTISAEFEAEPKLTLGFAWGWEEANTGATDAFSATKTDCLDQTIWFKAADLGAETYSWAVKAGNTTIVSGDSFENGKGGYFSLLHGGQNDSNPPYFIPVAGCELTLEVTPADKAKLTKTITVPAYTAPTLTVTPVTDHKNQVTVEASKTLKGQYFVGIYTENNTLVAYAVTETDASVTDNKALPVTLTAAEDVDFTTGTYTVKLTACPHDVESSVPTEPLAGAPVLASAKMTGGAVVAEYTITVAETTNGTATVDKAKAEAGTEITVTATPASDAYELDTITVTDADNGNVTVTGNKFIMPAKNVTVTVTFKTKDTTPVTPPSGGGGGTSTTPPVTSDKDSGTTSTTVKPSVKDESASVTVSNSTANALVNKTVQDKTDSAVIEVKPAAGQNVNEVKAEIPAKAVANLASKTDASLTVATPVANVTISNDALADVSKDAKTVAVTAAAKTDESTGETTYEVAVLKDGKPVDELGGELKVALPVDEQAAEAGAGLVAVLVDENGNETIITKSVLTEDGKLVMALNSGSATVKYVDNSRSYADEIPSWASDAVQFTSSRQLFMGVSENDFGANTTMNRAMLVTVLHRLEGEPTPTKPAGFQDVSDDSWYAASAAWSAEMGIVAGTENGFDGNRPITRQDLALMLYRYANVYGSGKGSSADFSHMGGADDVADYAAEAMRWAVGSGIIVGDENNNLDPQSPTTRAQVSVMLMRFVELLAAK